jgi:hypothetical protein
MSPVSSAANYKKMPLRNLKCLSPMSTDAVFLDIEKAFDTT